MKPYIEDDIDEDEEVLNFVPRAEDTYEYGESKATEEKY
jgi:hypothetical protein